MNALENFTKTTLIFLAGMPSVSLSDSVAVLPMISSDIHLDHAVRVVADEDLVYGPGLKAVELGDLPDVSDVDAVHGLEDGSVLFSLESAVILAGTLYRPSDVIRYSGGIWSKEFDGRAAGIPDGVNVDAITRSGETLLLSLDVGAQIDTMVVSDADVIAFDGSGFSIFLGAAETGLGAEVDVDALHVDGEGRILVSLESSGNLNGFVYQDEDLLAWSQASWSLQWDNSDPAWIPADLDAWSVVFINDSLFLDGFEQE